MKGGASAAPRAPAAPPKPAAGSGEKGAPVSGAKTPAGGAARPASAKPGAPSSPKAPAKSADDDPFGVDTSEADKAVAASPRPAPGKPLEVICPMCETKGYVPAKAAGGPVRCANPACLVPIFQIPAGGKKPVAPPKPPPSPKKTLSPVMIASIGLAVVGLGGLALWEFVLKPPPQMEFAPLAPMVVSKTPAEESPQTAPGDQVADQGSHGKPAAKDPVDRLRELSEQSTSKILRAAIDATAARKAYYRRLAATAFIASGDRKSAGEQIEQLRKIGVQAPYERILPTVSIAWQQVEKGEQAAMKKSLEELAGLSEKIPTRGRYAREAAIATAALFAATGKATEARALLAKNCTGSLLDQVAATLQIVEHNGTFDVDVMLPGRSLGDWQSSADVAVTLILGAHGRWDDAQAWATGAATVAAKTETTVVLGEAMALQSLKSSDAALWERALALAEAASPAGRARLLARLADLKLTAGDKPAASALIEKSKQGLAPLEVPKPVMISGLKALLEMKLPDAAAPYQLALAWAELGRTYALLEQPEPAWNSFQTALTYVRATAPSLAYMAERVTQLDGAAADSLRTELKSLRRLTTDDQVRRAIAEYREKCVELFPAAELRFLWQAEILAAAAEVNLLDQVWNEIQVLDRKPAVGEREPLLASVVPVVVAMRHEAAGRSDQREAIYTAVGERLKSANVRQQIKIAQILSARLIADNDPVQAAAALNELLNETGDLHEWALRLVCRLVNSDNVKPAMTLAFNLKDGALREDGVRLAAALAARTGRTTVIEEILSASRPGPEFPEVATGTLQGLAVRPRKE
jgi:hypothetical protein